MVFTVVDMGNARSNAVIAPWFAQCLRTLEIVK